MRLQLSKKMKINEAKKYVAEKLGITLEDLADVVTMTELRAEKGLGVVGLDASFERNIGMAAKFKVAEILDIKINSVERFKKLSGCKKQEGQNASK